MYNHASNYLQGLHVLRGLAAVSVVFFHAADWGPVANVGTLSIVREFGAGVTLFFVLSGYSLFLSNHERTQDHRWLRSYALKRFFRIAPLWYFMILASAVFHFFEYGKVYTFSELLRSALPLFNLFPGQHTSLVWAGWTIGVEVVFYVFFPLLLATMGRNVIAWSVAAILIGLYGLDFYSTVGPNIDSGFAYMAFPRQFIVFVLGALACAVFLRCSEIRSEKPIRAVSGVCAALLFGWWVYHHFYPAAPLGDGVIFKALAFSCLAATLHVSKTWLFNPVTKFWGDASYAIYLIHPIIVYKLKPLHLELENAWAAPELSFLAYALLCLAITCIAAFFAHRYVEDPLYKFGVAVSKGHPATVQTYKRFASG